VLGLGPFGSVPLQRSVKVEYLHSKSQFSHAPCAAMFSPRSADTYTKEWPSGGDQGPVLGLGPFGSVPLQRSVKVGIDAPYLASSFPIWFRRSLMAAGL
jgi:hypothetical protein